MRALQLDARERNQLTELLLATQYAFGIPACSRWAAQPVTIRQLAEIVSWDTLDALRRGIIIARANHLDALTHRTWAENDEAVVLFALLRSHVLVPF